MKIGVISDTHIPERASDLPKEVYVAFENVELIIHAGDLVTLQVLESLKKICTVKAVLGNMDSPELSKVLKTQEEFQIKNFKIGVMHGRGNPETLIERIKERFSKKMDLIIFGHSHQPFNKKIDNTLFFNPGTPTDTVFAPYRSYGIIEINDDIKATIVKLV